MSGDKPEITRSTKAFIPADKTTNFYKLDKPQYNKLLKDSITSTYKKADKTTKMSIDREARSIAAELKIDDRTECIAPRQAFITLKDHKENFANNPTCRLINPAKSELGIVSKKMGWTSSFIRSTELFRGSYPLVRYIYIYIYLGWELPTRQVYIYIYIPDEWVTPTKQFCRSNK